MALRAPYKVRDMRAVGTETRTGRRMCHVVALLENEALASWKTLSKTRVRDSIVEGNPADLGHSASHPSARAPAP
jgi:hypothetical protein